MFTVKIKRPKFVVEFFSLVRELIDAISALRFNQLETFGGDFMFTVPNDQPDVSFGISAVTATDKEGESVPVTIAVESDNPDVVAVKLNDASDPTQGGTLSFGKSGVASVTLTATAKSGRKSLIVKASGAQFHVTTGEIDPGSVSGGDFTIPDLTADPEAPTE